MKSAFFQNIIVLFLLVLMPLALSKTPTIHRKREKNEEIFQSSNLISPSQIAFSLNHNFPSNENKNSTTPENSWVVIHNIENVLRDDTKPISKPLVINVPELNDYITASKPEEPNINNLQKPTIYLDENHTEAPLFNIPMNVQLNSSNASILHSFPFTSSGTLINSGSIQNNATSSSPSTDQGTKITTPNTSVVQGIGSVAPRPHFSNNSSRSDSRTNITTIPAGVNTSLTTPLIIDGSLKGNTSSGVKNTTTTGKPKGGVDTCKIDEDCGIQNYCSKEEGVCHHKSILQQFSTYDIIGFFAHFFFSLVTVGVGSGVLFMSNLMIVLGFSFQKAAPISSILTLVAHVSRNFFSFLDRHPEKNRPMINYDISTVFAPMMLLGTIFGVICNHSFPKWLIISLFALIFSYITYKTFTKGLDLFQKEHEKNLMGYSLEVSNVDSSEEVIDSFGSMNAISGKGGINGVSSDETKDQQNAHEEREQSNSLSKTDDKMKKISYRNSVREVNSHDEDGSSQREILTVKSARIQSIELGSLPNNQGNNIFVDRNNLNRENSNSSKTDNDFSQGSDNMSAAPVNQEGNKQGDYETHTMPENQTEESRKKLDSFIKKETRKVYWESLLFIFAIMLLVVVFSLLRGSKRFPSPLNVSSCDVLWWILTFAFIPFAIVFTVYSIYQRNREYDQKLECNYEFSPADFKWNKSNIFKVITSGFFTGVIGSMFGIGGSVVCSPILIQLKLHPLEANYTASFMTLFTSIASALQYILVEEISWDYTIVLMVLTFISTVLGLKYLLIWLSNNNKQSYIIFLLAFVILGSIVSILYSGITDIIAMAKNNGDIWSFKSLC
jgi:uncharacterized membrane protein YfcA